VSRINQQDCCDMVIATSYLTLFIVASGLVG
jgi:hypothetical protein